MRSMIISCADQQLRLVTPSPLPRTFTATLPQQRSANCYRDNSSDKHYDFTVIEAVDYLINNAVTH
jgi:hypothetical protein